MPNYIKSQATIAELEPGDLLYVPPGWYHLASVQDDVSISISVWTPDLDRSHFEYIKRMGLPWTPNEYNKNT